MARFVPIFAGLWLLVVAAQNASGEETRPVLHLRLAGDGADTSSHARQTHVLGRVEFNAIGPNKQAKTAAAFNGTDACVEIKQPGRAFLPQGDFTLTAWVHTDESLDDVPGDIISHYDPKLKRGFHLSLQNNAGVANSQANFRQLQFGIDDNRQNEWVDCGRPGNAILAFALVVHDGQLYAGTCEPSEKESGHVYRYEGGSQWVDCGSPAPTNAVTAMAAHDGSLYAATGKYRLAGSALPESTNANSGGRIFRYAGESRWIDCGALPGVEAVGALVVFRDRLYASSLYRPAGFFRYEGDQRWTDCGTPGKRVEALGVYNGFIYATSYDGGRVFRYDGTRWTDCGQLGAEEENTQTYSFAVYQGRLMVGTWRTGRVYRFEDLDRWTDVGRLGEELEVMGMLVHNGRLMAGTLPLAEVYTYEGDTTWRHSGRLDLTPDVRYRRAWTMAEYQGRLFCSTLPSGRVYSYEAGKSVTWDHEFPPGWHHLAAVKSGGQLRLYVDHKPVVQSEPFDASGWQVTGDAPLLVGFGQNDYFRGQLSDVRVYDSALDDAAIESQGKRP